MMQDSPGSGQPRDREDRGWSPVPRGYRPAVMQPGTGPGRMGHAGQEEPRIQTSAGPEALHPPAHPHDSRVKYGKGGPHHPGTRRMDHEKVTNESTPALPPGGMPSKEVPQPDYWEKHLRSTKHLRRPLPPRWEEPPVDMEREKATVGASRSQSDGK